MLHLLVLTREPCSDILVLSVSVGSASQDTRSNRQCGLAWPGVCISGSVCMCVWGGGGLGCVNSKATWLEGNHVSDRVDKFTSAKRKHIHTLA